ncbi:Myb-like DNA-binding domain protein [Actinomortierella ambigua]|nr:Myb-like DNA-binding domain protein [Actinomortierella ambigua]
MEDTTSFDKALLHHTHDVVNRLLEGRLDNVSYAHLAEQENLDRQMLRRWLLQLFRPFMADADEIRTETAAATAAASIASTVADQTEEEDDPSLSSSSSESDNDNGTRKKITTTTTTSSSSSSRQIDVSAYPLLATAVLRPWTSAERDRLCMLAVNERSWDRIAQALDRDPLTCREKYHHLNRALFGTALHQPASRKRNPYWAQLRRIGFTPAHRKQLVRALEQQQRQLLLHGRQRRGVHHPVVDDDADQSDRGGRHRSNEEGEVEEQKSRKEALLDHHDDHSSIEDLFMDQHHHHSGPQGMTPAETAAAVAMGILPPGSSYPTTSDVDWEACSRALGGAFSANQLQDIYKILAKARLIWTDEEDARLIQIMIRRGGSSGGGASGGDSKGGSMTTTTESTTAALDEVQDRLFWTEVRDSFNDPYRTPDDYKNRWRMLDMPLQDRPWEMAEQVRFWRRFMEFHRSGSLINSRLAKAATSRRDSRGGLDTEEMANNHQHNNSSSSSSSNRDPAQNLSTTPGRPVQEVLQLDKAALWRDTFMWDAIAEGLEFRHGRDCQEYFERMTNLFPRDPALFGPLVQEVANKYLRPQKAQWSEHETQLAFRMANEYYEQGVPVSWLTIARALDHRYTERQIRTKVLYLKERVMTDRRAPSMAVVTAASLSKSDEDEEDDEGDLGANNNSGVSGDDDDAGGLPRAAATKKNTGPQIQSRTRAQKRWSDKELELLKRGVAKYQDAPQRWQKVQQEFLPHRTRYQIRERYERSMGYAHGRFTSREQQLLEDAIEYLGEGARWEDVAQMVPGRTAVQCRLAWSYGQSRPFGRTTMTSTTATTASGGMMRTETAAAAAAAAVPKNEGTGWSPQDLEHLIAAVNRYGTRQWSKVAELVAGKSAHDCRNEWLETLDPKASGAKWSSEEVNQLMERVSKYLTKQEEVEYEAEVAGLQRPELGPSTRADGEEGKAKAKAEEASIFVDPRPRFKGRVKIDWNMIAEGMEGRSSFQCYRKFQSQRKTYLMLGDF